MTTYLDELAQAIGRRLPEEFLGEPHIDQLLLLYALLGATKGSRITPEDVHDAWVVWRLLLGDQHESMIPFEQLDPAVQAQDEPYRQAILSGLADLDDGP